MFVCVVFVIIYVFFAVVVPGLFIQHVCSPLTEAAEKERVASWPVEGESILDMYAGTLSGLFFWLGLAVLLFGVVF